MPETPAGAVQSIAFAYRENDQAVPIRDVKDGRFLGEIPEWQLGGNSDPAAYVAGTRARIQVVFNRSGGLEPGTWTVQARGTGGPGVTTRRLELAFDAAGHSQPCVLELDRPLPPAVGLLPLTWEWTATDGGREVPLGKTQHLIYLVRGMPVEAQTWHRKGKVAEAPRPPAVAGRWVYLPLLQWTCQWAAGLADDKAICDAIIGNVRRTGLQYAIPAWTVRDMLLKKGGFCGGWYCMFQAMAGAQGVGVERRSFWPYWPTEVKEDVRWCAIVVRNPGVNQTEPQVPAGTFHDVASQPVEAAPVKAVSERRYCFWGSPGIASDGHCINLLHYRGRYYVYDTCFFDHAIPLDGFTLPDIQLKQPIPAGILGNFKEAYLQNAVDYMLGTIVVSGKLYRALPPQGDGSPENGITVQTSIIPHQAGRLDFYWMS